MYNGNQSTVTLSNSTVTNNSVTTYNGGGMYNGSQSVATLTNNTINGGPTLTHALTIDSPAIDLAPAADCSGAPTSGVDQRGVARSQDGNGGGTAVTYLQTEAGGATSTGVVASLLAAVMLALGTAWAAVRRKQA